MEKCIYNDKILYASDVLQSFDFEQSIRNCHSLICCDCGAKVHFKHGKKYIECFAHYRKDECKYSEYSRKRSDIFKYAQHALYSPMQKIAEKHGLTLDEDVILIKDHYTAFVLKGESKKYAIDIIDTTISATILEKRKNLYEDSGYKYLQITVDKSAESQPFHERDNAYFPVKYSLNTSLNHTAIVIDKERKNWFIYILDNMDISDVEDNFYDYPDWYIYDTFSMPITLDDIDINEHGFFTATSSIAFSSFYNNRRNAKNKWIKEETIRHERQRRQAEEARKLAEIRRQESELRLKEAKEKRKQEAEAKQAAAEAAERQAAQVAEQRRQKRVADEKAEIAYIHKTTGGYVGSKINGKYEVCSLESLTSTRPSRDWLCEYQHSHFMERIGELQEYKQSGIRTLFAKMCFIKPAETAILLQILSELKSTDSEAASVIEYLMQRAGIQ